MAIDTSGKWWRGSEPADLEEYLVAYSSDEETPGYEVDAYRPITCECGTDRFRLLRAGEAVQRGCDACDRERLICAEPEDWEEAAAEQEPEAITCVECGSRSMIAGVGFALYADERDIKWLYIGNWCGGCGVLGCVADREVGYGPAGEVFATI